MSFGPWIHRILVEYVLSLSIMSRPNTLSSEVENQSAQSNSCPFVKVLRSRYTLLSVSPNLRSGFTLIELLTVIAIIGILAAILIPTVGKVRQSGQSAKCASNLRQIGMQLSLFANDNKGFLPAPGMATVNSNITDPRIRSGTPKQMAALLWSYYSSQKMNTLPTQTNHSRHEMFICPSVDAQSSLANVPLATNALCYIINDRQRIEAGDGKEIYIFGYPNSASIKSLNVINIEKFVFGTGPDKRSASLSNVWAMQDGDRSLLTNGSSSPTGPRASQTALLAGEPAHKSTRNRLYLDGSVKKLTLALSDD
jgi:prepilin-type N-terminal cleavage/methylation domain-containing protein